MCNYYVDNNIVPDSPWNIGLFERELTVVLDENQKSTISSKENLSGTENVANEAAFRLTGTSLLVSLKEQETADVIISDMTGKALLNGVVKDGECVNIENLRSGVYVLTIVSEPLRYTAKLCIK